MRTAGLLLLVLASSLRSADASGATDDLMAMVPPDAGIVLAVEGLRDRAHDVLASPVVARLRAMPVVREWEKSARGAALAKSRTDLESALGISLDRLRDDLIGDSAILALRLPEGREPSGLLLTRFRDRSALDTLLNALNSAEKGEGVLVELAEVPARDGAPALWHRRFAPGTKPDEWYGILPDSTFAWSNSESTLRDAITRAGKRGGLGADRRYGAMREALPAKVLARLYVDPKVLAGAAGNGGSPVDPKVVAALEALDYLGAAIEWRDGPVLHLVQALEPRRVPQEFRAIMRGHSDADPLRGVPRSAVVVARWRWDLPALYDAALAQVAAVNRPQAQAVTTALRGLLLGKDPRRDVLPALTPGGLAYFVLPTGAVPAEAVVTLRIDSRQDVADALTNALRTVSALAAMDKGRKSGPLRLEEDEREGLRVTTLRGDGQAPAFGATAERLVLASSADAARRALTAGDGGESGAKPSPIEALRSRHLPRADGFVAVDLEALHAYASVHRGELAKKAAASRKESNAEADRDVGRALDLLEPFGGFFASWDIGEDGRTIRQTIGLVGREPR